ncbi:MAG: hypothetical protein P8Y38_06910 [Deltaproteobacteria bacterium]
MKYLLILIFLAQPLAAQTLEVIHKKALWWDGRGKIEISDEGISFIAEKEEESRSWRYQDIQYFDRISGSEFTILSYEDSSILLGRDRQYHFLITEGELTNEIFYRIRDRLNKPATNREFPDVANARYELPVKHLHTFGGCEGTLKFTEDKIYYITDNRKDASEWRLDTDIQSVWSSNPYELEIHAFDNNRREFSRTRIYKFDLKKPLDPEVYRSLKLKLYDLDTVHRPLP